MVYIRQKITIGYESNNRGGEIMSVKTWVCVEHFESYKKSHKAVVEVFHEDGKRIEIKHYPNINVVCDEYAKEECFICLGLNPKSEEYRFRGSTITYPDGKIQVY